MTEQPDIAAMSRKSRQRACELLGLDPNSLKPADEILVARVGALRLIVSDAEAAALRGEQIDLPKYIAASEALEAAIRTDHQMTDLGSPAAEERLKEKFREVIGLRPKGDPDDPDAASSETEQLRQRVAELEAENLKLRWGDLPPSAEEVASEPASDAPAALPPENVVPFREPPKYHTGWSAATALPT
jgi:hypothetical protein